MDDIKYLEEGIYEKHDIKDIDKYIKDNEFLFTSKDYNNGLLELEMNKKFYRRRYDR